MPLSGHHVNLQGFCGLPKGPAGRCLPANEQAGSGELWASDRPGKKVLWAASFNGPSFTWRLKAK